MRDVIIACDFKNQEELFKFLEPFKGENPYLKIGMELFYKEGPELVKKLHRMGFKIFLDLKLHDIPNTVEKAMRNLGELGVEITNVHAEGGIKMMEAARRGLDAKVAQSSGIMGALSSGAASFDRVFGGGGLGAVLGLLLPSCQRRGGYGHALPSFRLLHDVGKRAQHVGQCLQ